MDSIPNQLVETDRVDATGEDCRFTLRIEPDLREALIFEARRQLRSLNAEIRFRLRQTLVEQHQPDHRMP